MKAGDLVGGKYRLVRRLGQGAMGVVWEAVHDVTARHVAMKLIVNSTDNLRLRLLREARAAGKISHRNVVEVFDIGETSEQDPFLVMQLLVGETLYAVFKREGGLDYRRGVVIMRDISRALVAAHAQGIVHRDLKPANVFLHREAGSQGEIVKVLDFGLCKPMGDSEMLTTPGGMLGSPAYMAPEQIIGVSDIDPRTDIWALGVLAFELFSGKRPFQGRGPDLIHAVLKDPIPRLRDLLPGIDPDLDEVVAGCIVRDRNQRFMHASDVLSRLELLADRADGNAPREPMPSVDEEDNLNATLVYRAGSPPPMQTYSKAGKTIPIMSASHFRPAPPSTDTGPQLAQTPVPQPARPSWPASPPSNPSGTPSMPPPLGGNGPQGAAMMQQMTDAGMAQWRAQQQAQQQAQYQQQPGYPMSQGPVVIPPPQMDSAAPLPLRPWIAVVMGIGIGLAALLAIIAALSFSSGR